MPHDTASEFVSTATAQQISSVIVDSANSRITINGQTIIVSQNSGNQQVPPQRIMTDGDGRFEVTGLANRPEGYELAFVGSSAAPWRGYRDQDEAKMHQRIAEMPLQLDELPEPHAP